MQDMRFNGGREKLQRLADELAYPALLLDREYKICYKNDFCINRLISLRMGSCIKKHMTASDFRRIVKLQMGETIRVNMELPALYGAFVYRGDDCCLISLRSLSAALQNRINELMRLNSELTESLLCQLSVLSTESGKKGISELIKNKSNRIIRAQQHISEFLRIVNGIKNTRTRLCEVNAILETVVSSLRDALRPLGLQITYNSNSPIYEGVSAMLCEPDFNMIICHMINFSIRISQRGKIQIDVNTIQQKLYISVMTDSVLPEKTAKALCNRDLEAESFFLSGIRGDEEEVGPDGWMHFELLLLKKLCEYYLWDIRLSAPSSDYSRLQVTLSLPLEDKSPYLTVRDREAEKKDLKGLIAVEFSDVFDR